MRYWILCLVFGLSLVASAAIAADSSELSGYVIKLAEKTSADEPQSVNVGGLVIVVIRDSGSRPPQEISVTAPNLLEPLGQVRGVQNDQGIALMGGGYTWHLFKPLEAGEASVKVTYTENGDDGQRVERKYAISVK